MERYPLHWPTGWPRTHPSQRKWQLGGGHQHQGWNKVLSRLERNLYLMGIDEFILSTNIKIRQDGFPYAQQKRIEDPGAACYFDLKGKSLVMAQDAYTKVGDNIRSLALALEGLRQIERHGGGVMLERAFTGFEALPEHGQPSPWDILGIEPGASDEEIKKAHRHMAKLHHPDRGGSVEAMAEINGALETIEALG